MIDQSAVTSTIHMISAWRRVAGVVEYSSSSIGSPVGCLAFDTYLGTLGSPATSGDDTRNLRFWPRSAQSEWHSHHANTLLIMNNSEPCSPCCTPYTASNNCQLSRGAVPLQADLGLLEGHRPRYDLESRKKYTEKVFWRDII